jgi:hypothetical protein
MPPSLTPCPPPPARELATLRPDRPVKIEGSFVHRFRDARGQVRYERVTTGYGDPRWYRVGGSGTPGR